MSEDCTNGSAGQAGYYYPDPPGDGTGLTWYAAGECFGGRRGTRWHFKHSVLPIPGPWDPDESSD
ncbi:hypothetical protein [Saccharothrix variisporea]|uniref:Uncharacterized protein n=1 Tax=Saccharothrix variisporea TaxID=543527 RepID=A0A495XDT7_9PSEU|nr:hypothetical protein [Saccharothrix variisporea]RKT69708.1 hypothetical protein DFJ66_2946 [Saccharothrix variisporea]